MKVDYSKTIEGDYPLGILFVYFKLTPGTIRNLKLIRERNPNSPVITISNGERLNSLNDYATEECGEFGQRIQEFAPTGKDKWLNSELSYIAWYMSDKKTFNCKRWAFIEYDTYVNMDLMDYVKPNEMDDVVGARIKNREEHKVWRWWNHEARLPDIPREIMMGVVPLTGVIVSDEALKRIGQYYLDNVRTSMMSELRFGSISNLLGYKPKKALHPSAEHIKMMDFGNAAINYGICHPVK